MAQTESFHSAGSAVVVFLKLPFFRENSVAPFVHSPPVAGNKPFVSLRPPLTCLFAAHILNNNLK